MATIVVFVLFCNVMWISFHGDSPGVHGLDDSINTTTTPINISKQFPVTNVAVVGEQEIAQSLQRTKFDDSYLRKSRSRHKQTNSSSKTMSKLRDITSGHFPAGKIDENRVSSGKKSAEASIRSPDMDNQRLSTLPAVMLSKNNKLYYSENSTEKTFVISLKNGNSGKRKIPKLILPTPPFTMDTHGAGETRSKQFPRRPIVETEGMATTKTPSHGKTRLKNEDVTSYNTRVSGSDSDNTRFETSPMSSAANKTNTETTRDSSSPVSPEVDVTVSSKDNGSAWSVWGACSVSCGTGTQERSRTCGPNCQQVESRECYLDSCHGILRGLKFSDPDVPHEFHINDSTFNQSGIPKQTFLDTELDACAMWSSCKDEYLHRYMSHLLELANCPCYYPFNLQHNNNVWDHNRRRHYQWVDVNATEEKLHTYKPGAYRCIRSLLFPGAATLAAQVCCYTDDLQLVTRGRNAGTPNLISPQISWELHYKIDILPWVICKGDWTRYNRVLPPNNLLGCSENPDEEQLMAEVQEAIDY